MIAEAGLAALWLAAAFVALQLVLGALALGKAGQGENGNALHAAVRPVAVAQGLLAAAAMALLVVVFLRSDVSVALVAANGHSVKPWLDKFAGAWGNHEGSLLLCVTMLGLAGGAVALFERKLAERTLVATLAAQAAIALGCYALLLFSAQPFARLADPPADGAGFDPLLQGAGLAFYSLPLYAGYVGLAVAFSFALGALVTRAVGPALARVIQPWVLGAWVLLALGIATGSYWVDGKPAWDWRETTALIAWLVATGLLHRTTLTRWRRHDPQIVLDRLAWPLGAAGAAFAGFLVFAPDIAWSPLLGFTAAAGLAVASTLPLNGRNLRHQPLHVWGIVVAYFGIALALAGMASERAFAVERLVAVRVGQVQPVGPFTVVLDGIKPVLGSNWSALEGHLTIRRGDSEPFALAPQSRFFAEPPTVADESAVATMWDGQLHAKLGQPQGGGRWQLRLWWRPFVTLICLGGVLIALGGALALLGGWWRAGRVARNRNPWL